ncbi:uncharacterized protein F4822DRAFT_445352 [Hypoxylon trugodes]|uniref:uncharacterized protein n=1 Tax=Hypoxylon trugodes TaxID=326681 RepID=UPI00218DA6D0|nr:uncharacterized protein F4822DRAFT_445352 [Hypoxylon trugodes]KAI1385377.1 hypothetical protein F4822DRAFT_445352 [Hypoxylon trugodes]
MSPWASLGMSTIGPQETEGIELECRILGSIVEDFPIYVGLIEHYLESSMVRVVPRIFVNMLLECLATLIEKNNLRAYALLDLAKNVRSSTAFPVRYDTGGVSDSYFGCYLGDNLRWEALGIYFTLVASSMIMYIPPSPLRDIQRNLKDRIPKLIEASSSCIELWHFQTWRRLVELSGVFFESKVHQPTRYDNGVLRYIYEMHRRLVSAIYIIDKSVCTVMHRPPLIGRFFCEYGFPLDLDDAVLFCLPDQGRVDPPQLDIHGWSINEGYCAATWLRLRNFFSTFREDLLKLSQCNQNETNRWFDAAIKGLPQKLSLVWQNLPQHVKYSTADLEKCTESQRFFLAVTSLEFLLIKLQTEFYLCSYTNRERNLLISEAQNLVATVLGMIESSQRLRPFPEEHPRAILQYAMPAAHILIYQVSRETSPTVAGDTLEDFSAFHTMTYLTEFMSHLGANSDPLCPAYKRLSDKFKAASARFEGSASGNAVAMDGESSWASWAQRTIGTTEFFTILDDSYVRL